MTETPSPDPQAILKMLESELALQRQQRRARPVSRTNTRIGSLVFVVVLVVGALFFLNYLAEVARSSRPSAAPLPVLIWPSAPSFQIPVNNRSPSGHQASIVLSHL